MNTRLIAALLMCRSPWRQRSRGRRILHFPNESMQWRPKTTCKDSFLIVKLLSVILKFWPIHILLCWIVLVRLKLPCANAVTSRSEWKFNASKSPREKERQCQLHPSYLKLSCLHLLAAAFTVYPPNPRSQALPLGVLQFFWRTSSSDESRGGRMDELQTSTA